MKWFVRLLVFVILSALLPLSAQSNDIPLVLRIDFQFWTYDANTGALNQLTNAERVGEMAISASGQWIAYEKTAPITMEVLERTGGLSGALPSDIWYVNISTGAAYPAAVQPEGATFAENDQPDNAVARGYPVWSSDEELIAWTELHYPDMDYWLGIHDLPQNRTFTVPLNLPPQYGVPSPLPISWRDGIALRTSAYDETIGTVDERLLILNADGAVRQNVVLTEDVFPDGIGQSFWVFNENPEITEAGRWYYYVAARVSGGMLVDPRTGGMTAYNGDFELFQEFAPEFSAQPIAGGGEDEQVWSINTGGTVTTVRWAIPQLSPNGMDIALSAQPEYGDLSIWRSGEVFTVIDTDTSQLFVQDALWGRSAWRIPAPEVSVTVVDCPDAPQPRLIVGHSGQVVLGLGVNNMRSGSGTTHSVIGEMPEGAQFTVLEGPVCSDGFNWWRVDYNGLIGWTAEGQGATYWLEPVNP